MGLLFFLAHVAWTIFALQNVSTDYERTEVISKSVPGVGGLIVIAATITPSSLISIALYSAAILVIPFGRRIYQSFVTKGDHPSIRHRNG